MGDRHYSIHCPVCEANITEGGRYRQRLDKSLVPARPALQLDEREILLDSTLDRVVALFR
jgi:hypothetical protein